MYVDVYEHYRSRPVIGKEGAPGSSRDLATHQLYSKPCRSSRPRLLHRMHQSSSMALGLRPSLETVVHLRSL